ncbi:MAG: DNA-directed DNA polymerase [Nanoarchaeota archaeon]|nr:DNA-directed DNA polymerase [Nanoarchaeota archaeon]
MIQFYPLDVTYKEHEGKAVIYLFGRTSSGEQILVLDRNFEPYFYVLLKQNADVDQLRNNFKKIKIESDKETAGAKDFVFVTKTEIVEKLYFGKKVQAIRVYSNLPRSVPVLRDFLKQQPDVSVVLEADIQFTRRYLIDKKITPLSLCEVDGEEGSARAKVKYIIDAKSIKQLGDQIIEKPRMLAFDIETYSPDKRIIPEQNPILMISFYGDFDASGAGGTSGVDSGSGFKKVITWKKFKTDFDYIEFVNSEADLLERFKEVVEDYKPDFMVGYFSDGFDLPYIKTRSEKYKIKLDIGLDHSNIELGKGTKNTAQITGIIHLDIFKYVSKILGKTLETESYRLDLVANELLGERKYDVDIGELHKVWDNKDVSPDEIEKFCIYNLQDSVLTLKLARKVLPNIIELVKIIGLTVYDVNRMSSSQIVEWYLINKAKEYNQLVPNRPPYTETKERLEQSFEGAFVFEPKPGLYKEVAIFDYRSLYPSIISSHNISPGTLDCSCCEDDGDYVPTSFLNEVVRSEKSEKTEKNEKPERTEKEPAQKKAKHWFCKKRKGFIPIIIEELIKRRMRIKEMMKSGDAEKNVFLDARQQTLKLMANSFYGYLGFFGARWYSIESAEAVTAYGRHYILKVINEAQKRKFVVLYSDTDSIFLHLEGKTLKEALDFSEEINVELPGIMELEFEGVFPAALFVSAKEGSYGAKKKYALLDKKGNIKVKGFESVRRNWSLIAKDLQEKVLGIVLREGSGKKALEYVKSAITDLKDHKVSLDKVQIFTQLQKEIEDYDSVGPHVRVAMRMKAKGIDVGPGSIIRYVITSGKERIGERARLVEEISQKDYDADYYINNQVIPAVDKILAIFGYSKDDFLSEKKQSKLDGFF